MEVINILEKMDFLVYSENWTQYYLNNNYLSITTNNCPTISVYEKQYGKYIFSIYWVNSKLELLPGTGFGHPNNVSILLETDDDICNAILKYCNELFTDYDTDGHKYIKKN